MSVDNQPARPLVIQTEHLDDECAVWLSERCELAACPVEDPRFAGLLARAEGLVVRTYTRVDEGMLASGPRLRVVGRAGVGLDNIDVSACEARGVRVVSTPEANTRAVVEYVVAMMLDALRPRVFLDGALDGAAWKRARRELTGRRELSELTLGVLGLGRIGTEVARAGAAFDMRVLWCDVAEVQPERVARVAAAAGDAQCVARVGFEELMRSSDVLTLHVDGRASNRGLIDARALAMCRPDVVLINTSRGFVVDAAALADFLLANKGACAMLDVHEPEPFDATYPLLDVPNAHLSPHIAAATARAQRNMSWVVRDVWAVLSGASGF